MWQQYFLLAAELCFLGIGSYFDIKNKEIPLVFFAGLGFFAQIGVLVL